MIINVLKYSLKVWVSSILIVPALYIAFSQLQQSGETDLHTNRFIDVLQNYLTLVFFSSLFSFVTFIAFFLFTWLVTFLSPAKWRKALIFACGAILTPTTFITFFGTDLTFCLNDTISFFMYTNMVCISAGVWYFRIGNKIANKKTITSNTKHHENKQLLDSVL